MAADHIVATAPLREIQQGNDDLVGSGTWAGTPSPRPTPLPGHEHEPEWDDLPLSDIPMPAAPGGAL